MNWKSFGESKILRNMLYSIALFVILLITFKAGEWIGSRKAFFSCRRGERDRGFSNIHSELPVNIDSQNMFMGHGAFGLVVKVATSTIVVQDGHGIQNSIVITKNTVIKRMNTVLQLTDLKANDHVVIIGSPDSEGRIEAKLIRVAPVSSLREFLQHNS